MEITSKQRAYLRGLANPLETILQIGKNPISPEIITQVDNALTARELIKLRVLNNSEYTAREAAEILAEATRSVPVQVIGTRLVLYRPNRKKPVIVLPKA